jgi:hypothetical protein
MTQQQRLLQAFKNHGELFVYEMMAPRPNGLGIAQYNARIKELRDQGHRIINKEKGHFVYVKEEKMDGYQKFKAMGRQLKGEKSSNPYADKPLTELLTLKDKAEAWLEDNQDHLHFKLALEKYESICRAITAQEAGDVLGG